jgi:hypothetical protein
VACSRLLFKGASLEDASQEFDVPVQTIRDGVTKLERDIKMRKQMNRPKKINAAGYISNLYAPILKKVQNHDLI